MSQIGSDRGGGAGGFNIAGPRPGSSGFTVQAHLMGQAPPSSEGRMGVGNYYGQAYPTMNLDEQKRKAWPQVYKDIFTGSILGGDPEKPQRNSGFQYAQDLAKKLKGKGNVMDAFKNEFGSLDNLGGFFLKGLQGDSSQFANSAYRNVGSGFNLANYFNLDQGTFDPTGSGNFGGGGPRPPQAVADERKKQRAPINIKGKRGIVTGKSAMAQTAGPGSTQPKKQNRLGAGTPAPFDIN